MPESASRGDVLSHRGCGGGVYLVPGVYLVLGGVLSPGEGGVLSPGGVCSRGV